MSAIRPEDTEPVPSAVAVGFFDGVHRGHRSIVRRARRAAGATGSRARVLTFDRHPMATVAPDRVPGLLTTHRRRYELLDDVGVEVVALRFDEATSRLSPEEFVAEILVAHLAARHVVVGENFRFGHRAAGDVAALAELGRLHGFEVETVPLLPLASGEGISSTLVREALADGDVRLAGRALGRPHDVEGEVVAGDRRGRELGFPTLNVAVDPAVRLPAHGIYAGVAWTPVGPLVGATSIGVRPTFAGDDVTVEAHLLDWEGDLYGATVRVDLRHRLRDELAFDDVDALVDQMHRDVEATRALVAAPGAAPSGRA